MAVQMADRHGTAVPDQDLRELLASNVTRFKNALHLIINRIMPIVRRYTIRRYARYFVFVLPWRRAVSVSYITRLMDDGSSGIDSVTFSRGQNSIYVGFDDAGNVSRVDAGDADRSLVEFVVTLATNPEVVIREILDNYIAFFRVLLERNPDHSDEILASLTEIESLYMDLFGDAPVTDAAKLNMFHTFLSLHDMFEKDVPRLAESVVKSMRKVGKVVKRFKLSGLRFWFGGYEYVVSIKADFRDFEIDVTVYDRDGNQFAGVIFDLNDEFDRIVSASNLENPTETENVLHTLASLLYNIDDIPRLVERALRQAINKVKTGERPGRSLYGLARKYEPVNYVTLGQYATEVDNFVNANAKKWGNYTVPFAGLSFERYDHETGSSIRASYEFHADRRLVSLLCEIGYNAGFLRVMATFDPSNPSGSFTRTVDLTRDTAAVNQDMRVFNGYVSLLFDPATLTKYAEVLIERLKDRLAAPSPLLWAGKAKAG